MRLKSILIAVAVVLAGLGGAILYDPYERTPCLQTTETALSGIRAGFEFIDIGRMQVWGTMDWTVDEFNDFNLPWHKPLYLKNDPRALFADEGQIRRSPGCAIDGEFNTLQAFGREFRHVVRLISFERIGTGDSRLLNTTLEKYHALTYYAGRTVNVLHSPDGEQYIEVARTAKRAEGVPSVPEGWQIRTYTLNAELHLELSGLVTNLRTVNDDSFQGPLEPEMRFPPAVSSS